MKKLTVLFGIFVFIFSVFCASETNAQARKSVGAAEVNGTFQTEENSEFRILSLGKGKLYVAFSGTSQYASAAGMTANVGDAEGEAKLKGDTAVFTPKKIKKCTITIKFLTGSKIDVKQKGDSADCGFGNKVSAAGVYKKVSSEKPKFASKN